ncbi:MAG: hypothetical protein CMP58_00625 [Flavobacteriales bacterium]|nr:hypothetical protein [Flavobacteriales bacterium]
MFNNVNFLGFINPWIYIILIIIIPQSIKENYLIMISFLMGLLLDSIFSTSGINTISLISVAWLRNYVLKKIFSGKNNDKKKFISIKNNGFNLYLKYVTTIVFIHHGILIIIDYINFVKISEIMTKTILSSIISIVIIMCFSFVNTLNQND